MPFNFTAGRPCLDLVRTVKARRHDAVEGLVVPDDLARWIAGSGIAAGLSIGPLDARSLLAAREMREAIYELVVARLESRMPNPGAVGIVNERAASAPPQPRLAAPACRNATLQADDPLAAVLSMVARDAIDLVTSPAIARVRECADAGCTALFLDLSRPGARRWCAMNTCGNQAKLRTYRTRRAAAGTELERRKT
ncbi:MAG: hypothetical protein JWL84_5704 [Rhodospirillales bacterium]|nr:hypothetical protein [Rhodospirillales bacterium]